MGAGMISVNVTFRHLNPDADTIWNRLSRELGREPTNAEAMAEVKRILSEGRQPPAR
jgi:hypothetical protein